MLTTSDRKILKSKASLLDPVFQIGKSGITDNVVNELKAVLAARELIKVSVLKSADVKARDIIDELAELTQSEPVQAIGSKIILYKYSDKKGIKHVLN